MNQQFRIQKFHRAVPGPAGATDDLVLLARLLAQAGGPVVADEVNALWPALAAAVPALRAMTFGDLPDTGLLLDRTPWAALAFPEGETLHYKPEAPVPPPARAPAAPPAGTPST